MSDDESQYLLNLVFMGQESVVYLKHPYHRAISIGDSRALLMNQSTASTEPFGEGFTSLACKIVWSCGA